SSDEDMSSPPVARRASPLFSQEILQRGIVEHGIGQHPLQPAVLVLQRPQPLGVGYIETAELGLPFIKRRRADPVFATDLCCWNPGLLFPQHRDDLLFREPSSLHRPSLRLGRTLVSFGGVSGGHVTGDSRSAFFSRAANLALLFRTARIPRARYASKN